MNSRVSVLRNICGQADPASQSIDLSKPKSDRVRLPHSRDLASRKDQSTIQYTFAIQQPRPQHLPRGLAQRIFSQPPRLSTSRLPLPHGSPRRSAKNALLYVNPADGLLVLESDPRNQEALTRREVRGVAKECPRSSQDSPETGGGNAVWKARLQLLKVGESDQGGIVPV